MDAADTEHGPAFDHSSFRTILSTLAGYGVILVVMTALFFLLPYAAFVVFG